MAQSVRIMPPSSHVTEHWGALAGTTKHAFSNPERVGLDPDDFAYRSWSTTRRNKHAGPNGDDLEHQNLFPVGHADEAATQQEYDDKIAGLAELVNAVETTQPLRHY